MEDKILLMEDKYICFSLAVDQVAKNLQKLKSLKMSKFDLRAVHVSCMIRLGRSKHGLTGSQLTEACGVDKSLISRVVNELLEKGYICYENADYKYRRRLCLTERGNFVMAEIHNMLEDTVSEVRKNVTEKEMDNFYRTLAYLDENLCRQIEIERAKKA